VRVSQMQKEVYLCGNIVVSGVTRWESAHKDGDKKRGIHQVLKKQVDVCI